MNLRSFQSSTMMISMIVGGSFINEYLLKNWIRGTSWFKIVCPSVYRPGYKIIKKEKKHIFFGCYLRYKFDFFFSLFSNDHLFYKYFLNVYIQSDSRILIILKCLLLHQYLSYLYKKKVFAIFFINIP